MKKTIEYMSVFILLTFISWVFALISIRLHDQFLTFGWDLGFFDQIIWKVSQGDMAAYSTLSKENLLADHFQVVLYPLSFLYLIKSDVRMILVAQAFLVVFAAFPLYLIAKYVVKSAFFSLSIVASYVLFIGTQWTILNEFHQMAFVPLFLSFLYYGLASKKIVLYWTGVLGLLMTKEELGLLLFAIGLVVWWFYRKDLMGIITSIIGVMSFFILVYIIMPWMSVSGTYSHFDFGPSGYTPVDVVKKIIFDPPYFFQSLSVPSIKVKTMFDTFFAFGFLPFFSPIHLLPIFDNFVTRFIYAGPQFTKWANVNHHAAPLGILSAVATIYASFWLLPLLEKYTLLRKNILTFFLSFYILGMSIFQNIILHGPVNSIFKPQFYSRDSHSEEINKALAYIPPRASLATQNNLFPHLSQRKEIYLLPEFNKAEYIMVDIYNKPNSFSPLNEKEFLSLVKKLQTKYSYVPIYKKNTIFILKR